ncbi:hypothetical protein [Pleomorphomonas carboxyditropha]|uniref:DUF2833 domain-containing protein n=1 Tax=Pleomorphomonas carboxyditropha TaxID=2023338 RepID=A0A2G9WPL1_9HYPH|nr:hypothetical protein [Pleomorphomonas carboxyditropha]PIO96613.1 hypothetical protein CJ014_24505 [Pleomorphomonas carboxyditropha]
MAAEVEIVPARGKHCRSIARRMRAADVAEVWRSGRLGPVAALRRSMDNSTAFTVLIDGRPEIMYGVGDLNVLAGIGGVWLLGTDAITRNWRWFLRATAEGLPGLFTRHEVLRNVVDRDNAASIRWLGWLGAAFLGDIDIHGHPFVLFELRRRRDV